MKREQNYKVVMSDMVKDERIELDIKAESVFDAIDMAADRVENPAETELIEAVPVV